MSRLRQVGEDGQNLFYHHSHGANDDTVSTYDETKGTFRPSDEVMQWLVGRDIAQTSCVGLTSGFIVRFADPRIALEFKLRFY